MTNNQSFEQWANDILQFVEPAMYDVGEGIGDDVGELLKRQARYTGYAGRLVEIYAYAEVFLVTARAEAIEELANKKIPASLVARIAEGKVTNELRVYEMVHRLNSTLSDQLIAIASRLRFEKNTVG
jgi:hypothetical protein